MAPAELISKRTRNEFRETLVDWTLREIDIEFDNEGFVPDRDYIPNLGGQRRSLVEQYYNTIDFTDPDQIRRLVRVYESILLTLDENAPEQAQRLRKLLERDGYVSDGSRLVPASRTERLHELHALAVKLDSAEIVRQIERIEAAVEEDPALAIGSSKELVESCCKTILHERGDTWDKTDDLPKLLKRTRKVLKLLPEDIPDEAKGADIIRTLLSNLGTVVSGLAEMRNLYGSGHGPHGRRKGLTPRHAKLAAGAASTLSLFLFETDQERD